MHCCGCLHLLAVQEDVPIPVIITPTPDKKFTYKIKTPPSSFFIKKAAGLSAGSKRPGHESVGTISLKHLHAIALVKQKDVPLVPLRSIVASLIGTCRSMGVTVVARPEDAVDGAAATAAQ